MTKDEALRIALEALEINLVFLKKVKPYKGQEDLASDCVAMTEETINAIKEALETKDEPKCVAIVEVFEKDWRLDYMSLPVGKHKLYAQQYTYTTPQQPKPLTRDEVEKLFWEWKDKSGYSIALFEFRNICKSIEAVHGIKE